MWTCRFVYFSSRLPAVCRGLPHWLHDVGWKWWRRQAKGYFQGPHHPQPGLPEALPGTADQSVWCRTINVIRQLSLLSKQRRLQVSDDEKPDHPCAVDLKLTFSCQLNSSLSVSTIGPSTPALPFLPWRSGWRPLSTSLMSSMRVARLPWMRWNRFSPS